MKSKSKDFKVGEEMTLLIKKTDGDNDSLRDVKKRGHVIGITSRFIVIQHKDYRECYLKCDFTTGRLKAI
ncbi:MAG TPA: hypothetical protein DCM59_16655 [Clostridium sp.]|nr:hypothetical protein [Clostridium sp.]